MTVKERVQTTLARGEEPYTDPNEVMRQRYARAMLLTEPKVAAETPGLNIDGYWLDEGRFFFLDEKIDPATGALVVVPSIADCDTRRVVPVMAVPLLQEILAAHVGRPLDPGSLATAAFDMPDGDTLTVCIADQEYMVSVRQQRVLKVQASLGTGATYSPDGRYACCVQGFDLWLVDRHTGAKCPLTTDGELFNAYGQESETCLSALSYRKRPYSVALWSPDSQWILTHRIDERAVPDLQLMQHVPPGGGGRPAVHRYKYPIPGDPIPIATYVAIHVQSGRCVSFDGCAAPILAYSPLSTIYRMAWFGREDQAWFLRVDRYSKCAELVELDLVRGTSRVALAESVTSGYIEFHQSMVGRPNVRTLARSREVIWFSERDGRGHLYLFDLDSGTLKNRITRGEWLVRDIVHVDEQSRRVYFSACGLQSGTDPARRSVCVINLDGSGFEVLLAHDGDVIIPKTQPGGMQQDRPFRPSYSHVGFAPGNRRCVAHYGSVARGNFTQIADLDSKRATPVSSVRPAASTVAPRPFSALAADGVTPLHGVLFFPSDFQESRRYPLVDYIYPGPHVAHQPQSFGALRSASALALAELGFVTFMLDARGMPFHSRDFHQAGYGDVLEPQLADHATVARQLCERHPFLDRHRVGMLGYSSGGAATARAMFEYASVFKVGVSVCGNHDPSHYAAMFSDKYRGPPNDAAWATQANAAVAHKLTGKLLLVSGDMDDNVHMSHTLGLADALIRANREFDLMIVPNEGHDLMITNGYVQRLVWDYFVRHLLGETPPPGFEIRFTPRELACRDRQYLRERELWR